jgi:hypothetical protein
MITPLPKSLTLKGWKLVQEFRKGSVAIYHKTKGVVSEYEVILISVRAHTATEPAAETYPSDMAWGTNGWTYSTMEEAMKKAQTEVYLEETD